MNLSPVFRNCQLSVTSSPCRSQGWMVGTRDLSRVRTR